MSNLYSIQQGDTHKDNIDITWLFIGMNSLATNDSKYKSVNAFLPLGVSIRHKKWKSHTLRLSDTWYAGAEDTILSNWLASANWLMNNLSWHWLRLSFVAQH